MNTSALPVNADQCLIYHRLLFVPPTGTGEKGQIIKNDHWAKNRITFQRILMLGN